MSSEREEMPPPKTPYTTEEVQEIEPALNQAFVQMFALGQKVALSTPVGSVWGYVSPGPPGGPPGLYLWGGWGVVETNDRPTCVLYVPSHTPYVQYLPVTVEPAG